MRIQVINPNASSTMTDVIRQQLMAVKRNGVALEVLSHSRARLYAPAERGVLPGVQQSALQAVPR